MNDAVTSMAPRGKRCTRCLCCDAIIIFDGEALCAACDDGTHPPLAEQHAVKPLPTPPPLPPSTNEIEIGEKPMKVTPALIKAIRESDFSESCRVVGDRLGLDMSVVQYYRTKMRNEEKSGKPAPAQPQHKLAERTASQIKATCVGSGHTLANSVEATILVTDKICDNWWRSLKLGDKAAIFASNYVIRIEGSVQ
jgi:hypothetical protein